MNKLKLPQIKQLKSPDLTIPGLHDLELLPFQKVGAIAIQECQRLILGDSCGLGKTIETLSAIQALNNLNELRSNDVLVICPGVAKDQWRDMCKQFTVLSPTIAETTDSNCSYLKRRYNLLIMSFSTMRSHVEALKEVPFKMIVLDESLFKNDEGLTYLAASELTKKSPRLVILNANTVENSLTEFYSHISLIYPGLISKQQFMDRFCNVETKWFRTKYHTLKSVQKVVGPKSLEALKELKNFMAEFYLARTPEDAGISDQLPKVVSKTIFVDLKKSQKEAYIEEIKLFRKRKIKAPTLLPNLLRICHGKKENWKLEKTPEKFSAKADVLKNLIDSFGNEPFVVYSTFNDPLLALAKITTSMGKKVGFFTGLQNEEDRQRHLKEFKSGLRNVLFINNAAQRAINIETCRYLICINQLYNPEAKKQLEGRIRRLSSKFSNVFVYHLIAKNTIEEKILLLQDKKEELAKYINTDGEAPEDLTDEQMDKLLGTRKSLVDRDDLDDSKEIFENEVNIQ